MISVIVIILLNFIVYHRTLSYSLICDDIPVYTQAVEIPKGWWMKFWYHLHGRKYTNIKFAHAITLGVHILNCVLIYLVFGRNTISLLASLLFSLNPVNNQCSIWISGKGYSFNTTCALLMWWYPPLSFIPYLFGTYFCGSSLLLFPLIFLFTKYWYLSLLVVWGVIREKDRIFNKKDVNSKYITEGNEELLATNWKKYILVFKTYGYHIFNSLTALRLGFYHPYLFTYGVSKEEGKTAYKLDRYFYAGIIAILILLLTRHIGALWFLVSLAMWSNFISFNQTITLRYAYLPNVGLMLLIASLLVNVPIAAAALLVYYATKLVQFFKFYQNEYYSIEWSCLETQDFFYTWQNRAIYCFQNHNFHGALSNMLKANELRPRDWKILYDLAQIYLVLGNINESKKRFEEASKYTIAGREEMINGLMKRLKDWIDEIDAQAKISQTVNLDLNKIDMQR